MQSDFFATETTIPALVCSMLHNTYCYWSVTFEWIEFGCIHKLYLEESDCILAVHRPKLVTETSLVARQYDRLSQQQLSFLSYLQDLLGVSMTVPIISKHAREIGTSPTVAGLIGKQMCFCIQDNGILLFHIISNWLGYNRSAVQI